MAAFTADLASSFRSACEAARLALVIDCPPLAEPVFVDREMWEEVVLNLLSNAFKFTFEGRITVAVRQEGARALARGVGHRPGAGAGAGEAARRHGGTVAPDSVWGEGSCFTVRLPLGRAHLSADHVAGAGGLASTATRPAAFGGGLALAARTSGSRHQRQ